jgi:hypothetical protein
MCAPSCTVRVHCACCGCLGALVYRGNRPLCGPCLLQMVPLVARGEVLPCTR